MQSVTKCVIDQIESYGRVANQRKNEYIATFSHGENSQGGTLLLDATTDAQAIAELRDFVKKAYRNETTAGVDLADGRCYQAWNAHGAVKGRYLDV